MNQIKINRIPGFILNPDDKKVNGIFRALCRTEGECPCPHEEWDETTPHEDKLCPCITYRNGQGCHCKLYLPTNGSN